MVVRVAEQLCITRLKVSINSSLLIFASRVSMRGRRPAMQRKNPSVVGPKGVMWPVKSNDGGQFGSDLPSPSSMVTNGVYMYRRLGRRERKKRNFSGPVSRWEISRRRNNTKNEIPYQALSPFINDFGGIY